MVRRRFIASSTAITHRDRVALTLGNRFPELVPVPLRLPQRMHVRIDCEHRERERQGAVGFLPLTPQPLRSRAGLPLAVPIFHRTALPVSVSSSGSKKLMLGIKASCRFFHARLKLRFCSTDSDRAFIVSKIFTPAGMCRRGTKPNGAGTDSRSRWTRGSSALLAFFFHVLSTVTRPNGGGYAH